MYTVTFYSYKGGVGRTLALVNVAAELARSGRRVLIVDFDLEAPGLDTFNALSTSHQYPGVVEFVSDYLTAGSSPDVRNYLHEVPSVPSAGANLWLMPAGCRDA